MTLGNARTTALWVASAALMTYGLALDHDGARQLSLLLALLAVLSAITELAHDNVTLLAHTIALFCHDRPMNSDVGARAQRLVAQVESSMIDSERDDSRLG